MRLVGPVKHGDSGKLWKRFRRGKGAISAATGLVQNGQKKLSQRADSKTGLETGAALRWRLPCPTVIPFKVFLMS